MESRDSGQFSYHSKISQDLQVISGDKTESITQLKASPNFNQKLIGTHSEVFHCDDVLACTMLLYTKEFSNSIIVRTRNENTFPHLDILVDVGSVFDPGNYRFDHHQRSFDTTWWDDMKDKQEEQPHCKIKLSSAGLVYKFFGKDVIQNILKDVFNTTLEEPYFNNLYEKLYQTFMIEIDALDNGVNQGKDLAYQIRTGLGMRVSRLNKAWNDNSSTTFNDQFKKAMRITEEELLWQIYSISQILIPARKMVQEAWNSKEKFHQNGQFLHIETACPWKQHLFEIEKELDQEGLIKFVFYKDTRGMYRVQAVPQINSEFENRISLHIDWRGLRGEELQQKSGFKDIDFVHHSGFIGGAWSLETVISMAERSLEEVKSLLKHSIQQSIKGMMVKTKYEDEPVTFGQAVVTQYFLTQQQKHLQDHQQSQQTQNLTFQQQIESQFHNYTTTENQNKHIIEFPLTQAVQPQTKEYYGRKKITYQNDSQNIKDVFQWLGEDGKLATKKMLQEQLNQASPTKWKTEQRENYRYFVDSPHKDKDGKGESIVAGGESLSQDGASPDKEGVRSHEGGVGSQDGKEENKKQLTKKQSIKHKPLTEEQKKSKNMKKRLDDFNATTRWLPDSAFTTYFGKPAFHCYGKGNTNPAVGSTVYGHYMLTHNVNPESGAHLPQYQQVYEPALDKGAKKNNGIRVPVLPRKVNDDIRLTPSELEEINSRNPIMPKDRKNQKGQSLGRTKTLTIVKPNLAKQKYFNSKHTTPAESQVDEKSEIKEVKEQVEGGGDHFDQALLSSSEDHRAQPLQEVKGGGQPQWRDVNDDLHLHEGQDIGEADRVQPSQQEGMCHCQGQENIHPAIIHQQCYEPLCQKPIGSKGEPKELNPRNYQFLPHCWTQRIRPAGKQTHQSERLYDLLVSKEMKNEFYDIV